MRSKTKPSLGFLLCILLLGLTAWVPGQGEKRVLERIVARVNDDIITLTEYNNELTRIRNDLNRVYKGEALEEAVEKQRDSALENIIQNKLLVQKAKDMGFGGKVDLEVSAYVERFRKENGIPDMRSLEQALAQAGMNMDIWREQIKNQILQEALIGTFVQSKVVTTDEEIQEYYKIHKSEFTKPAEVEIAEIVFYLEGNMESAVEAKAKAALERLQQGEVFEDLAKTLSEGPTGEDGGGIGTFKQETMAPEIEKAVFAVSPGEYTDIVKSKFGFQILKLISRKEAEFIPLEEVKPEIQRRMYYDKYKPLLENFLKEVRDESYVEVYKESLSTPEP